MKKLLLLLFLLSAPLLAQAANFSAHLTSYDPAASQWTLRAAVGANQKTIVGSAPIGQAITFAMGNPGDDVRLDAFTSTGLDTSPVSAEVTVHIPKTQTAPVLSVDLVL